MKRLFSLAAVGVLLICLTACGSAPVLNASYSGGVQITDGTTNYLADLQTDGESLTITFSAPESVAGISCSFRDGELHTGLNGLDCIIPADSLPPSAIPSLLYEIFSDAESAEYQASEDGTDVFILPSRAGDATVTAKGGVPLTLTRGNLSVTFR